MSAHAFHNVLKNPLCSGFMLVLGFDVQTKGVQGVLKGGRTLARRIRHRPDFPPRRFVLCSECKTPLTGSWSTGRSARYAYDHCWRCGVVKVRREYLESRFVELLEQLRPQPEYLRLLDAIVLDVWNERQRGIRSSRKLTEHRIQELQAKLDRVEDAFI